MKNVDDRKLAMIVAREIEKPDFPAEEFRELLSEIGEAASSTTKACLLAIQVFTEAKKALMFKFSGSRVVVDRKGVARCINQYFE